ncbi:MAG: acyl-CoA desaturase [Gammaproteobacteria bacterium]|nr:acyl-CoA desaturase [Gammaproteobacteria bacterium]
MSSITIDKKPSHGPISPLIIVLVAIIALLPLTAFTTYFKWADLAILVVSFSVRAFAITAGYHRYLSHNAFKTSRVFQFIMAFLGSTTLQGGPLWWASLHRHHHMYSDQKEDISSPVREGFWHSHMCWFMYKRNLKAPYYLIKDLYRYPELRLLERYWYLTPLALIIPLAIFGGWNAVVWGFFVSAFFINHATYCINSVVHIFGRRRYDIKDNSRNNWWAAIITFGEGWHNNHHRYAGSARMGFTWYEIDISYYILKILSLFHIVWDLRPIPEKILREGNIIK